MGALFVATGLIFEYFDLAGFSNKSGYWHLKLMEPIFYALHSEINVVILAAICNFILGAIFWLMLSMVANVKHDEH